MTVFAFQLIPSEVAGSLSWAEKLETILTTAVGGYVLVFIVLALIWGFWSSSTLPLSAKRKRLRNRSNPLSLLPSSRKHPKPLLPLSIMKKKSWPPSWPPSPLTPTNRQAASASFRSGRSLKHPIQKGSNHHVQVLSSHR